MRILVDDEAEKGLDENSPLAQKEEKKSESDKAGEVRDKTPIKLTARRQAQFIADFDTVVVNNFGDEYHMTEEERIAHNEYYAAFRKVRRLKKVYRKATGYVKAMREIIKCLDLVAEKNGIYSPEKFKKKFFKGKINVYGLEFPRFKGREKKLIDVRYLYEFIFSDRPAEEIDPSWTREEDKEETLEELQKRMFFPGELEELRKPKENKYEYMYFDPDTDSQEGVPVAVPFTKKELKLLKKNKDFNFIVEDTIRKMDRQAQLDYVTGLDSNFTSDDFDKIAKYDKKYGYKSKDDYPEFHGSVMGKGYKKYMRAVEKWEDNHILVNYMGKMITQKQYREYEVMRILEEGGWNTRLFDGSVTEAKKKKKKAKRLKKKSDRRMRELKDKLIKKQKDKEKKLGNSYSDKKKKKDKKKLQDKIRDAYNKEDKKLKKKLGKKDKDKKKDDKKSGSKSDKKSGKKSKKDKKRDKDIERSIKRAEVVDKVKRESMEKFNDAVLEASGYDEESYDSEVYSFTGNDFQKGFGKWMAEK